MRRLQTGLVFPRVKVELDDLSLRYLEPEAYKELSEQFPEAIRRREKEDFVEEIMDEVSGHTERERHQGGASTGG